MPWCLRAKSAASPLAAAEFFRWVGIADFAAMVDVREQEGGVERVSERCPQVLINEREC